MSSLLEDPYERRQLDPLRASEQRIVAAAVEMVKLRRHLSKLLERDLSIAARWDDIELAAHQATLAEKRLESMVLEYGSRR